LIDKNMKNMKRIIEWAQSGEEAAEITREIAENAIKKYKSYCSKKTLMNLTAITLNAISSQQKWRIKYSARRNDIKEPRLAEDITRTLGMLDRKVRVQREILEKLKDQMTITAKLDETIRFKRPPLVPGDDRKLYIDTETIKKVTENVVSKEKIIPDTKREMSDIELEEKLVPEKVKDMEERLKTGVGIKKGRHGGLSFIIGKAKSALKRGERSGEELDMILNI
jgi:hypothetical protein